MEFFSLEKKRELIVLFTRMLYLWKKCLCFFKLAQTIMIICWAEKRYQSFAC